MELGETGIAGAVPYLIEHMKRGEANERRLAASAIKKLAEPHRGACLDAVPALLTLVDDQAPQVRQYALNALIALKPAIPVAGIQRLKERASSDPKEYVRTAAANAVKACGVNLTTLEYAPAAPQPHSSVTVKALAQHYHDCVEARDRKALLLKRQNLGKQFLAPKWAQEYLLSDSLKNCEWGIPLGSEQTFLSKGAAKPGEPDLAVYGYPLLLNKQGELSPLFVVQVAIEEVGMAKHLHYRLARTGSPTVNRHLFTASGLDADQTDAIEAELNSDHFATFGARLAAAFEALGEGGFDVEDSTIDPFPTGGGPRWFRTPILLRSSYGPFSYNLRQDLKALVKYPKLQTAATTTALGALWGKGAPKGKPEEPAAIRPLNPSQEAATRAALSAPLAAITGPPGTGKSQVVVGILASAILSGRRVLFASNNNHAVDVVRQRLREALGEPYDFTVRVGSQEKMAEMPPELRDRLARLVKGARPSGKAAAQQQILDRQGELKELALRIDTVSKTAAVLAEAASLTPASWREAAGPGDRVDTAALHSVRADARAYAGLDRLGVVRWVRRLLFGSAVRRELTDRLAGALAQAPGVAEEAVVEAMTGDGFGPVAEAAERAVTFRGWLVARATATVAEEELRASFRRADTPEAEEAAIKAELAEATAQLCRITWGQRLYDNAGAVDKTLASYEKALDVLNAGGKMDGVAFAKAVNTLKSAYGQLAAYLPIWITTNVSVRNALPLAAGLVDLVVVDEASQCDVAGAIPLLYRARRAAIIGDPMQLRHIPGIDGTEEAALSTAASVLPAWSYVPSSLFDHVSGRIDPVDGAPFAKVAGTSVLLNEHYRSVPEIIEFSNEQFYSGALRVRTDIDSLQARLPMVETGVFWHDTPGQVPSSFASAYNPDEISAVVNLIRQWVENGWFADGQLSVGVVTPFRAQKERIKQRIEKAGWYAEVKDRLSVGTAYGFQGDEKDVVVFSPVVADGMLPGTKTWAATTESLLNVSVTRARAALHIVGDRVACTDAGGPLAALVHHAEALQARALDMAHDGVAPPLSEGSEAS